MKKDLKIILSLEVPSSEHVHSLFLENSSEHYCIEP